MDFDTLQKTRCFYLIVWVPTLPTLPHVRRRWGRLFGLAAEPRADKKEPGGKGAAVAEGRGEVVEGWGQLLGLALPSPLPAPPQRRAMVQGEEVFGGCPQAPVTWEPLIATAPLLCFIAELISLSPTPCLLPLAPICVAFGSPGVPPASASSHRVPPGQEQRSKPLN